MDEEEVQRRAATDVEHRREELVEGLRPYEEGECLVLVRRPGMEPGEQEGGGGGARPGHAEPKRMARGLALHGVEPSTGRAAIDCPGVGTVGIRVPIGLRPSW